MPDDRQPDRAVLEPLTPATVIPATPDSAGTPFEPTTRFPATAAEPGKAKSNLATPGGSGTLFTPTTSFPASSTGGGGGGGGGGSGASGPPVHINTDLIALGIPQVTDFGNRITTIHATLMSAIGGLGEPWGDDENGAMFAESYLPARPRPVRPRNDRCPDRARQHGRRHQHHGSRIHRDRERQHHTVQHRRELSRPAQQTRGPPRSQMPEIDREVCP
jgi:hypothetical protein